MDSTRETFHSIYGSSVTWIQLYPTGGIDFEDETAVLVSEKLQRHRQLMTLGKYGHSGSKLA